MALSNRAEPASIQLAPDAFSLGGIESILRGSHELEDLLPLVLAQIVDLVGSDTAAILLLERKSNQLVARAAHGLEEEVRQGVRIPVGTGFAGRIAAERRPVRLDRVDDTTVANPILWQRGIRSMLGVPLLAGSSLLGVVHVGSFRRRAFHEGQLALLQGAADILAVAIEAATARAERRAAAVLQRSLLPSALPDHARLEFASRYAPAERGDIGGDWFDAFEMPSGDVWVMTGDVIGHGLNPAIVMGRLRSTLRAYALLGMSPEDVLRAANRKLAVFEPDAMATVICGILAPPFAEIRLCSAGHPHALLARPGESAEFLDTGRAPPLGAVADLEVQSGRWKLTPGSSVILYTDGLIERRQEDITERLEHLRCAVRSDAPDRLCGGIMDAMIGNAVPADDVALLALRVTPFATPTDLEDAGSRLGASVIRSELFACDSRSIRAARRFVGECVQLLGLHRVPDIQLIVSELATNAVRHARSEFDVLVEKLDGNAVRIEVRDFGGGEPVFATCAEPVSAEENPVGGRGLKIVDLLTQRWGIEHRPEGAGKSVWFVTSLDNTEL